MTIPYLAFLPFVKAADAETLKEVSFEMLFFAVACMAIGTVATSLGLSQMVSIFAGKMLGGESVSMFKISAAVFAVVFILNFLMTPMAIWSLASAPIIGMALEMGLNPVPFVYMLISTAEAIIFPYEYVPYLILYGLGFMGMKDFIVLNVFRSGAFFIGFMVLLIPWWMLIGLL